MSNKFKVEYYSKTPQLVTPYMHLMDAKRRVSGYKYEVIKNDRGSQGHNKSISQTQYPQPSHKHSKTQSHEKEKARSMKQNSKKKRSHTEAAEDRLHESLFLNRDTEPHPKEPKHQATKSLFTVEAHDHLHSHSQPHDHSINPVEFMRNCRNLVSQEATLKTEAKGGRVAGTSLQRLEINQIDDLISLIDTCIEESNDYINYLTEKLETMRSEVEAVRQEQARIVKMKDGILSEKEQEIDRLRKEVYALQHPRSEQAKSFEVKKLLEIIDKITEENTQLRARLEEGEPKFYKEGFEKEKKDIYNEIHNKIDILNISIDKKNQEDQDFKDPKKPKFKPKFYK